MFSRLHLARLLVPALAALGAASCAVDPGETVDDVDPGEQIEAITLSRAVPVEGECNSTATLNRDATGLVATCSSVCKRDSTLSLRLYIERQVDGRDVLGREVDRNQDVLESGFHDGSLRDARETASAESHAICYPLPTILPATDSRPFSF